MATKPKLPTSFVPTAVRVGTYPPERFTNPRVFDFFDYADPEIFKDQNLGFDFLTPLLLPDSTPLPFSRNLAAKVKYMSSSLPAKRLWEITIRGLPASRMFELNNTREVGGVLRLLQLVCFFRLPTVVESLGVTIAGQSGKWQYIYPDLSNWNQSSLYIEGRGSPDLVGPI